jgi:hypothetical protein
LDDQGESIFKELKKLGVKLNEEGEAPEMAQFRGWVAQLNTLLIGSKRGQDYAYYPGAKLDEKDRIVFWYKNQKTGEYAAVYGDLRTEKVGKDQLSSPENTDKK